MTLPQKVLLEQPIFVPFRAPFCGQPPTCFAGSSFNCIHLPLDAHLAQCCHFDHVKCVTKDHMWFFFWERSLSLAFSQLHLLKECDLELLTGHPVDQERCPATVLHRNQGRQQPAREPPPCIKKNEIPTYFLCCRYPDMSRRVFRGKDRKSFCTCCFHDNNLFF